jgi:hypothetical protein
MLNEINMFLKKEIKNLGWVAEQTLIILTVSKLSRGVKADLFPSIS